MNAIIRRTLKNGKTLEIISGGGALLIANVDGKKAASGGLVRTKIGMVACGKVPVSDAEAKKLKAAIDEGKRGIAKKMAAAKAYNDIANEGGEGFTHHAF